MKAIAPALAIFASLLLSVSALAGPCPKNLPRIVGMDYHHARAELISRNFLPAIPMDMTSDNTLSDSWRRGYLELDISASGRHAFAKWDGFSIVTGWCEYGQSTAPCRVEKVICP
jgi:hypothetical protein